MINNILLYVPQTINNNSPKGGQLTAANGLIHFLEGNNINYTLVNTMPQEKEINSKFYKLIAGIKRIRKVKKTIYQETIDYSLMFKSGFISLFERYIVASILKNHNIKTALFFRNSNILFIKQSGIKSAIIKKMISKFDILFVQGENIKKHLEFLGIKKKIIVIPNWLPKDMSITNTPKKVNEEIIKFIFTGRVVENKGVFQIAKATSLLNQKYSNFEITIIGDGPAKKDLENYTKNKNIQNLHILGQKDATEIKNLLSSHHVLLLPTRHLEGFPNSILEAMALGLPVISSDVGAICESIYDNENGFIINPQSVEELASCMEKYITDYSLINKHSIKTLEIVQERHNRDQNCTKLLNELQEA